MKCVMDNPPDKITIATGSYINIYDSFNDIFIILNEPNDPATPIEVQAISACVYNTMEELEFRFNRTKIERAIEKLDLNCTKFGCQAIKGIY